MVTHKDPKSPSQKEAGQKPDKELVNFRVNKKAAVIGGTVLSILSFIGVKEVLQSPEDDVREALAEVIENNQSTVTTIQSPTTTRVVVESPNAPPATNVERPEVTSPSTLPEAPAEELLIRELAPTFSEIVNAAPVSPYDIALKVKDFPNPTENPTAIIEANMKSMSYVLTHSYGDEEIIRALFYDSPENPYPKINTLFADATNIGRFRFPPENDPEYTTDKPNFGVLYRPLLPEKMTAFTMENGSVVVIQTFGIERIHFNYDEDQQGWFLTRQEITATQVSRTFIKRMVPLETDSGEIIETEVWQVITRDQLD